MFSTTASQPHSVRKRMLSNVYSKSYLHKSHALRRITSKLLHERLLPSLIHTSGSYEQHTNTLPRQVSLQRCAGLVDVLNLFSAITMDFVSAYQFGLQNGSRMTRREDEKGSTSMTVAIDRDEFFHLYRIRQAYTFWPQEHPRFTQFLHSFGIRLVPKFVDEANVRIEDMIMRMCDSAAASLKMSNGRDKEEKDRPENTPTVFKQLSESLARKDVGATKGLRSAKNASVHRRQDIASEMLDHLAAGFETSGITLSYATYELSKHPEIQAKLREELRSLHGLQYSSATSQEPTLDTSSPSTTELPPIPDAKDLDSLTLLHAIILETLRLHAAIPGPQPRVTPYRTFKNLAKTISTIGRKSNDAQATGAAAKTSNSLVGHHEIPGGIRVSAQAYSLHRNQDIFPEPEEWRPNRWLLSTEEGKNFNSNNGVERSGIGDPCDTDVERFKEMHRWFWAFGSGGRMCVGNNLAVYRTYTRLTVRHTDSIACSLSKHFQSVSFIPHLCTVK